MLIWHFNPHSHEGSDTTAQEAQKTQRISIHTPMKGVTTVPQLFGNFYFISIHTPMKGVTIFKVGKKIGVKDFNPHSHEGSDSQEYERLTKMGNFNPHSHEGSDWADNYNNTPTLDFNPHSHEGSDWDPLGLYPYGNTISIHTPMKGVTM